MAGRRSPQADAKMSLTVTLVALSITMVAALSQRYWRSVCVPEHSVLLPQTEESQNQLSADTYYKYEDIYSRPSITPDSEIPENLLYLTHSFGYDSGRRANLQLLDDRTLIYIAGNLLILLDISTKEQRYLRSCSGGGIGSITRKDTTQHHSGTEKVYSSVDFNRDGNLLVSIGGAPDYMLTLWHWRQEEVMLSCKAVSQEVYRVSFSSYNPGLLTSSGSGHIKFWKMASTFTGIKLQGLMGHFGKTTVTDIEGYVELPDGKVVSGTDWGNMLLWDGNTIKVEICQKEGRSCHAGMVQPFALEDGQLMTIGSDGVVRVNQSGGLLVAGFDDGVVRLLELYHPQRLHVITGHSSKGDAELHLKQALKPHNAPVTAVAYERNGQILATGGLEWSPHFHSENSLLILCQTGHVLEVQCPDPEAQKPTKTFHLPELPTKYFKFRSIKSQIKRKEEEERRQTVKKKKKEREERLKELKQPEGEQEEAEKEEELPPNYIPDPPSFDSGFLYHCKFSEKQDEDPDQRQDEPFDFKPVHNTDDDPVRSITFSSNRQLMFLGMHSGAIRVYLLQPADHSLASMQAYWSLSVHDNQYGHLRHIRCSHDDNFVLTAGDDGNIFSFSLLPPEELQKNLQKKRAKVPSPRQVGLEKVGSQDIVDSAAYSIETAKQKLEKDRLQRQAELKIAEKQKKLAELQKKFKEMVDINQSLPEHVRLKPEELQLDQCFSKEAQREKSQQVMKVRKQLAWEEEHVHISLSKLKDWFKDSLEANVVTVIGIHTNHRVSTYRLPMLTKPSAQLKHQSKHSQIDNDRDAAPELWKSRAEPAKDSSNIEEEEVVHPKLARPAGIKLGDRQVERLQKAAEKAEQARAKIEKRKQEWEQLYAEKPDENCEDPLDVQAIHEAKENIGDLKLKSAKDFMVPKQLRMNTDSKRAELIHLEENILKKQTEMNGLIVALRDSKVCLMSQLRAQAQQLDKIQLHQAAHLSRSSPTLPTMLPEETLEKCLQCSHSTLEQYQALRGHRLMTVQSEEMEGTTDFLEQLIKGMKNEEDDQERPEETTSSPQRRRREEEDTLSEKEGTELSDLEEELQREKEIRLLYKQDSLLKQMESSVCQFNAELMLLRHQKLHLDWQLKIADLRQLTLYQELLLLREFERREDSLQEKFNTRLKEESNITSELEERKGQLELRQREIAKLQEREKVLITAFHASLGEDNKFEEFLTKVFRKRIKRVKKKEQTGHEGCEPEFFENTLQLRERRQDLEELLMEEKKSVEALKKECDTLTKKVKAVKNSRKAAEDDLELVNREKQQRMNELHVVVPLRLHQIEFVDNSLVPPDLSLALVVDRMEVNRLHERLKQLQVEKNQQRDLYVQARQQHVRLLHNHKELDTKIQVLEKQCNELMMMKYGRLVDLEALQTRTGNRVLEELKQEKLLRETAYAKEIKQWDGKVEDARQKLMDVTKANTERLLSMTNLLEKKRNLEQKLNTRRQKKKMDKQFQDYRRHVDQEEILRLTKLVKTQSQHTEALCREVDLLYHEGGHILLPSQAPLTSIKELIQDGSQDLTDRSSSHCSSGPLTADIWLHRFLVNTEPLWILVTGSRYARLWILRIRGSSTADSRHTLPMASRGTTWMEISTRSYSEPFCACTDWKQVYRTRPVLVFLSSIKQEKIRPTKH
ncbi:hypothetical protein INR49_002428 [Caranx melampygus]|nr:hypothetical protein INR49_002428 [Caranx melampygus]